MSKRIQTVPVVYYFHEYALNPFYEISITCPDKGGRGNTPLCECVGGCEQYSGIRDIGSDGNPTAIRCMR